MVTVSLTRQINAWRNVLFALYMREIQSQFNDKLGLGWAFVEPLLFIAGLSYLRSLIKEGDVHSIPIFIFMMIGMVGVQLFLSPLNKLAAAIQKNRPLYAFRQVQPIAGVIAAAFIEFSIKIGVVMLAILILYLTDKTFEIHDPLMLISLFVMLCIFTFGLSLIIGICQSFVPEFKKVFGIVTRPVFFISGVFFSLQDIPQAYWHYLDWNPLLHFIELARYACFESYGDNGVSYAFVTKCTFISLFMGLSAYYITWKKLLSR
jgi:capsular polysaccharide transport system permease protein